MTAINKERAGFYAILVYIAYVWFMLLDGFWFFMNLMNGKHFNIMAFTVIVVFMVQAYYKNKLANLIIGILVMCASIWMLMDVLSNFDLFAKDALFSGMIKVLLSLSIVSIIMSGILIFSYMMLNKDVVG